MKITKKLKSATYDVYNENTYLGSIVKSRNTLTNKYVFSPKLGGRVSLLIQEYPTYKDAETFIINNSGGVS